MSTQPPLSGENSTLSELSTRLARVIEQKRRKEKLERDLASIERNLAEKTGLLNSLEQQLRKEQVDVERLEHLSLSGLFYAVLGSKEQQVEKERQEVLAAQLKYQQAKREVDSLRADDASLRRELSALGGVERQHAALLAEKEDLLKRSDSRTSGELLRLSEEIANRSAEKVQVDEAIAAATPVMSSLDGVIESLQSAEGWGTWDLLGGGFLSNAVKHSHIDDARVGVQEVQQGMQRFTRELADVQRDTDLSIDIGEMDVFADFFFDGLIMDWIVQSKIEKSLEQARLANERINQAVKNLERLRAEIERRAQSLADKRRALVERS